MIAVQTTSTIAGRCALVCIAMAMLAFVPGTATAQQTDRDQFNEPNTNRFGGDFMWFELKAATPSPGTLGGQDVVGRCRDHCKHDSKCRAWSLVKAGVQAHDAKCWLKNTIPPANHDTNVTSGVMARELELATDRPGFDLPSAPGNATSVKACQSLCTQNQACVAWVFKYSRARPANSQCFLKKDIPAAVQNECCTAGVVFRDPVVR